MIKKIYTILVLIKNVLIKKRHYTLSFFAEFDKNLHKTRWFYDFKHWGFDKANLEMVSESERFAHMFDKSIGLVKRWEDIKVGLEAA